MALFNFSCSNLGFHNNKGGVILPPFKSDLTFDFFARDIGSLTLQETGTNNAAVIGGNYAVLDGAGYFTFNTPLVLAGDFEISVYASFDFSTKDQPLLFHAFTGLTNYLFYIINSTETWFMIGGVKAVFTTPTRVNDTWQIRTIKRVGSQLTYSIDDEYTETITCLENDITINQFADYIDSLRMEGKLGLIEISNGDKYYFNGHPINAKTLTEDLTPTAVTYVNDTDFTSLAVQPALDEGWLELSTGEQVVGFIGEAPVGSIIHNKAMHNLINSSVNFAPPIGIIIDGQSNAAGRALVADLPIEMTGALDGCYILNSSNEFVQLEAGVNNWGVGDYDATAHGLEIPLAYKIKQETSRDVYIIKRGRGGSFLVQTSGTDHSRHSEEEYHDSIIGTINNAPKNPAIWDSYIWIQGESEVSAGKTTQEYYDEWKYKIADIVEVSGVNNVIDYLMPSWLPYGTPSIVNTAKANAAVELEHQTIASDLFGHLVDNQHLNTDGFISFADDIVSNFVAPSILNRSDPTVFNASARLDDYDPLNPYTFRIDKLDYDVLQSMYNAAYQDRNFAALLTNYGTQLSMFRFFSYANPKTSDDLIDVLNYINYIYEINGLHFYYSNNSQYLPLI